MAVEVDNAMYTLDLERPSTILYRGKAPVAKMSYRYVKINKDNYDTIGEEFHRSPEYVDTVNEFFNRTWNKRNVAKLPQIFKPSSAIQRIPTQLHRNGEIPTIHLIAGQEDIDTIHEQYFKNIKIKAGMSYVSLNDSRFYDKVELSISGRTSRWYSKVSYNIKLRRRDRLYGFRRIKLRSLGNDPSYIREQLAYDMIHSLGLPSTQFSYCRVFLNNIELGLFGLIEPFQDPWAANEFEDGDESYVSGSLYQGNGYSPTERYSDLGYMRNLTAYADGQYLIKAGEEGDFGPLQKFTKFIKDAPINGRNVVREWGSEIDMNTFLRSMVLEVLNAYFDGYIQRSHNYYLYMNPGNEKHIYIPADLDATLGFSLSNIEPMMTGDYTTFPGIKQRPLISKVLRVKEFRRLFEAMLLHVTKRLVNPRATNRRIDDLVSMITEDVEWDQTTPRMGTLVRNFLETFNITHENGRVSRDFDLIPFIKIVLSSKLPEIQEYTSKIPDGPGDYARAIDYVVLVIQGMPFLQAVNGPTGHPVCLGVKEFIRDISRNVLKFYGSMKY